MTTPMRPRPRTPISRRLATYFMGVAIGIVLVGFLLNTRRLMVQPADSGAQPAGQGEAQPEADAPAPAGVP